jgi:hypothetical protein
MDTDIRDELDRSFDEGPPIDDLDLLLARGHTAVRRRRLAGIGSVLVVAGAVATVALLSSGTTQTVSPAPAGSPSTAQSATPVVPDSTAPDVPGSAFVFVVPAHLVFNAPAVTLQPGGVVELEPGVEVVQAIDGPFDRTHPTRSIAVEYVRNGSTYWFAGAFDDTGARASTNTRAKAGMTFQEWVDSRPLTVTLNGRSWPGIVYVDPQVDPFDAVDLRADGNIYVNPDVVVTRLDQHPWPEPEGSWAVALVYEQGGETHWYAGRQTGTNGTAASTTAIPGRTFEDWVAEQQGALLQGGGA